MKSTKSVTFTPSADIIISDRDFSQESSIQQDSITSHDTDFRELKTLATPRNATLEQENQDVHTPIRRRPPASIIGTPKSTQKAPFADKGLFVGKMTPQKITQIEQKIMQLKKTPLRSILNNG